MPLNAGHLTGHVIRPTLAYVAAHATRAWIASPAAVELVLGTALAESELRALVQYGGGPARGLWQMEPATCRDLIRRTRDTPLGRAVLSLHVNETCPVFGGDQQLIGNLYFACAMCRLQYAVKPDPLPPAGDVRAQAAYWKRHYNTHLGAGTIEHYVAAWSRAA